MARRAAQISVPPVENDVRAQMFNAFMVCSHRDTEKILETHQSLAAKDPLFYAHLASWYQNQNQIIRDHNELFCALLMTDTFEDNREVGLALFRRLPAFMKNRVVGFIKGKMVKLREKTDEFVQVGRKKVPKYRITEKKVGLDKSLPSSLRTEIRNYLEWLEKDPDRFDSVVMRNRKDLKSLYFARGRSPFTHSTRAQKVLFEKEYPENSKLAVFKKIAEAKPDEAAELIVKNKIPYAVAVGLADTITPSVLVALVNSMTPQEVITNIASLKEKGAWDHPEVKAIIEKKLEKATTAKNVTALKSKAAVKTGRIKDEALVKKLDDVADAQVKKTGTIKIPTAVFVDRSGSLTTAIEVGKSLSALISGVIEADFRVVAFDNAPMEIVSKGKTLSDWERAFKPINPGGSTSIGCALRYVMSKEFVPEQIVVVTDEGENASPYFHEVFPEFVKKTGVTPHVIIIHVGNPGTAFRELLKSHNIAFDAYVPEGKDYYGLPGLIPMLARRSKLDLVMEIMEVPLLKRGDFR